MNHNMSPVAHLKWMLVAGGGALVVLALSGVSLAQALPYALLLACPLMMFFMMFSMSHGQQGHSRPGQNHPGRDHHDAHHHHGGSPSDDAPLDDYDPRWTERRP
jgi:hypothetical protein